MIKNKYYKIYNKTNGIFIILSDFSTLQQNPFSKRTSPRKYDLYDVFNALLYVLSTGCQWRALPKNYPKWQNGYRYYAKWSKS
ncbi:hypothetical protein CN980_15385, partial [Bacillus cereus]